MSTDQTAATECAFADEGCTCGRPRLTLTEAQARMAAAPKPGPTFATYLDRHDRDQLDARAACAEQERDEALDARNVLRQQLDTTRAELGAAQELLAVVDDLAEQLDRARARYATRPDAPLGSPTPRAQDNEKPRIAPFGCDDCSVEHGERHRYADCPTNLRQIERDADRARP